MLRASALRVGREFSQRPFLKTYWSVGGSLVLAGAAHALTGSGFWPYIGATALILAVAAAPLACEGYWERVRRVDSNQIELRGRVLSRTLSSHLRTLAKVASGPVDEKRSHVKFVATRIVHDLVEIYGPDDHVRATVYALSDDKQRLTPIASFGREDKPRDFVRSQPRGHKAIGWLLSNNPEPKFEPNTDTADPRKWEGTSDSYKTFISIAVMSDDKRFGMLTMDAPHPGALAESDSHLSQAFAGVMAIAFAEGGSDARSQPRQDER